MGTDSNSTAIAPSQPRRYFFVAAAAVLLLIVLVGFAPSFFLKAVFHHPGQVVREAELLGGLDIEGTGLPPYVVAHGILTTAWMVLFFAQAMLIASDGRALHRRLGLGGLVLAVGVAATGLAALVLAVPRLIALADPPDPSRVIAEQLPGFAGDFGTLLVFTAVVAGAGYYRARPERHKQLMLLAAMTLISPPLARIWLNSGVENAMEVWHPLTESGLAVLIIGGYWLVRRRAPWVLLAGFVGWLFLYGTMTEIGGFDRVQTWALGWMT